MTWFDSSVHRALAEAVLVGALGGVVGVHVLIRRLPFFTMALTHATFPGIVIAALLGADLYLGGGVFGLLITLAVVLFSRVRGQDFTAATGIALAGGFALGVVLVSAQDGFAKDLTAYTVGDILAVSARDLAITAGIAAAVTLLLVVFRRELLITAFDPVGAAVEAMAQGRPVVVVDDADRENEGDIVFAAEHATPALMGFTIRHSSGVVCVPMTGARADAMRLPPMVDVNEDSKGTAYTVTCDARLGVSTGISAD